MGKSFRDDWEKKELDEYKKSPFINFGQSINKALYGDWNKLAPIRWKYLLIISIILFLFIVIKGQLSYYSSPERVVTELFESVKNNSHTNNVHIDEIIHIYEYVSINELDGENVKSFA